MCRSTMKEILLDGSSWKTTDDVYDTFFSAVGAPSWHGRNFNALSDSIATGRINEIEVPYRLVIQHYDLIDAGAKKMVDEFIDLIHHIAACGCPIEIQVNAQGGEQI